MGRVPSGIKSASVARRQPGSPTVAQVMRPQWGKANEGAAMSQPPPDGEQGKFEIVFELPPSPEGTYRYDRVDGTTVHGDASGEWTLDEDGEVDDIVFFVSPGWVRDLERRGLLTHTPSDDDRAPAE